MSVQRIVEDAPPIDLQAEAQHTSGEVEEPVSKHGVEPAPRCGSPTVRKVRLTWTGPVLWLLEQLLAEEDLDLQQMELRRQQDPPK